MVLKGTFTATQDNALVTITVPLKGTSPKDVDVYTSDVYVKVSYAPYILHIDLLHAVRDDKGTARVVDGKLKISLPKQVSGHWDSIEFHPDQELPRKLQEEERRTRRDGAMERKLVQEQARKELIKERLSQNEKLATKRQMEMDERERNQLEDRKESEKKQAEAEVYDTFAAMKRMEVSQRAETAQRTQELDPLESHSDEESSDAYPPKAKNDDDEPKTLGAENAPDSAVSEVKGPNDGIQRPNHMPAQDTPPDDSMFTSDDCVTAAQTDPSPQLVEDTQELDKYVPPPRQGTNVKLAFTPRVFPTPMRESKQAEEENWILRNRRHLDQNTLKKLGGRDISERDPFWLKGKGDDLFRAGDAASAVSAYTCAIELDETMVSCYSNRAACFLKLKDFDKCVRDCQTALEQMMGFDSQEDASLFSTKLNVFVESVKEKSKRRDRNMAKKLLVRRGTALCASGNVVKGLEDYQLARECDTNDKALELDCLQLQHIVKNKANKDVADQAFKRGNVEEAVSQYSKILEDDAGYTACYSNRAACYFSQKRYQNAIEDCDKALTVLNGLGGVQHVAVPEYQPIYESDTWKTWKKKLYLRRGASRAHLGELRAAIADYTCALELDPQNRVVAKDLVRLEAQLAKEEPATVTTEEKQGTVACS